VLCDVSRREAVGIAKAFYLHFDIPKVGIHFTKKELSNGGEASINTDGLYYWFLDKIVLRTPVEIFALLHELTHHLQNYNYGNSDQHGKNFTKAKGRVLTWARGNVCPCVQSKQLNGRREA